MKPANVSGSEGSVVMSKLTVAVSPYVIGLLLPSPSSTTGATFVTWIVNGWSAVLPARSLARTVMSWLAGPSRSVSPTTVTTPVSGSIWKWPPGLTVRLYVMVDSGLSVDEAVIPTPVPAAAPSATVLPVPFVSVGDDGGTVSRTMSLFTARPAPTGAETVPGLPATSSYEPAMGNARAESKSGVSSPDRTVNVPWASATGPSSPVSWTRGVPGRSNVTPAIKPVFSLTGSLKTVLTSITSSAL